MRKLLNRWGEVREDEFPLFAWTATLLFLLYVAPFRSTAMTATIDGLVAGFALSLLTYLKVGRKRLGYLINYNVPLIKNGIKRFVC